MRLITLILIAISLTACSGTESIKEALSGINSYFSGGEDNSEPPTPLALEFHQEIKVSELWNESVGVGANEKTLKLVPAVGLGKIFAADAEGLVEAHDLQDGRQIWSTDTEVHCSAGPSIGDNSIIVGTSDAEVIALKADSGEVIWRSKVSSEVLSVPLVAKGIVVIRTTDGAVTALDEKAGGKLWSYESTVPALSIRGNGAPIVVEENVIVGYDNGKLIALRLTDGKFAWEISVAQPKGRSEIERLVDLDVDPIADSTAIYVSGYHGGTAAISELDGTGIWRNDKLMSSTGLSIDSSHMYLTDLTDNVYQVDQRSGESLWKQKDLQFRKLTAPANYHDYVVVGDVEGYVHWLSKTDGRLLARVQITKAPIDAKPIVVDNTVYIYAKDGTLAALSATPN